jgi:hypothetical protein
MSSARVVVVWDDDWAAVWAAAGRVLGVDVAQASGSDEADVTAAAGGRRPDLVVTSCGRNYAPQDVPTVAYVCDERHGRQLRDAGAEIRLTFDLWPYVNVVRELARVLNLTPPAGWEGRLVEELASGPS